MAKSIVDNKRLCFTDTGVEMAGGLATLYRLADSTPLLVTDRRLVAKCDNPHRAMYDGYAALFDADFEALVAKGLK